MGGKLCCMRQPITDEKQPEKVIGSSSQDVSSVQNNLLSSADKKQMIRHINSSTHDKFRKVEYMTLEDCFLASPNLNNAHHRFVGGEIQIFKHLPKKVYPSSPDISQEFFTPRRNFSADRLGRIGETYEDEDGYLSRSSLSRSGSGKVRKKVRFKLPEEADIFIYDTPKETFEEC